MMSDSYKYILQYVENGVVSNMEFPADLTIDELQEYLGRFLATAGWSEEQVKEILRIDDV